MNAVVLFVDSNHLSYEWRSMRNEEITQFDAFAQPVFATKGDQHKQFSLKAYESEIFEVSSLGFVFPSC